MIQRKGWSPIPKWIADDQSISHGAFRLYVQLASVCHNGNDTSFERVTTIARRMGATPRSVRRWREELVEAGLIDFYEVEGKSNNYVLRHPVPRTQVSAPPRTPVSLEEKERKKEKNSTPLTTELRRTRERKLRAC